MPVLQEPNATNTKTVEYKKLGTEPCGGSTCLTYRLTDAADKGTTTTLWFRNTDYQLQRTLTINQTSSFDATYDFAPVTLGVPSPVKVLKKGQAVGPNQSEPLYMLPAGN